MIQDFFKRKFVRDTLILQIGKVGTTGMTILASVLVFRLLKPEAYGEWALIQSFFSLWQTLNLSGVSISTSTRLAIAGGAENAEESLNLMAFYTQISAAWAVLITGVMALVGAGLASKAYNSDWQIGVLATWLSLTVLPDALYNLVVIAFQSQRSMRTLATLQNINQFVLLACTFVALFVSPTPAGMVFSRLAYSMVTMGIALGFYQRMHTALPLPYPAFGAIVRRAWQVSPRPYWRFGVLNALDKNVANLYTEIPLQLVGIFAGKAAAGYLELAFKAMTLPSVFTSAVFDNLQAVVPRAVGRGEFERLQRNIGRITLAMAGAAAAFYTLFALVVPIFVPPIYGRESIPAIPVIQVLAVYGAITMVGGIFGPLYRALNALLPALLVKIVTLVVVMAGAGWFFWNARWVVSIWTLNGLFRLPQQPAQSIGALAGAWMLNGLFGLSVALTVAVTLPILSRRVRERKAFNAEDKSKGEKEEILQVMDTEDKR